MMLIANLMAQPALGTLQKNAMNNALNFYSAALGDQSPLYNGPEYYFYDPHIKGNAYFLDANGFTAGSVYYDGVQYNGVPMLYDVYGEKIVVLLYNHFSKFSLLNERVKSFNFLQHQFINITPDSLGDNRVITPGFYDVLYNGKSQVLVKRSKDIQTTTGGSSGSENYFNLITRYYLKKNNTYYSITSQGTLLDAFKDRKKEVQKYIKDNQIKFRKGPEEAMVKIASYYDHLTN
ncbi:MAG TPA: hypothetical protein VGI43_20100 [Mucilaginibacter sp.]|jgi:hypothetical protein